ncbi:MAG TPA: cupredoxin domain-containing protein [Micropepsaceae bacterium]|nr:cupredoxin domain-containing protein [Micropepsaceae bacterium]
MTMRSCIALGCAALGILLAGAAPPSAPQAPRSFTIEIKDFAFGAAPSGIHAGDAVEWVNNDILLHSVTAQDKSFDMDIAPGAQARRVMKKPGIIRYFCKYHPGMTGEITVAR